MNDFTATGLHTTHSTVQVFAGVASPSASLARELAGLTSRGTSPICRGASGSPTYIGPVTSGGPGSAGDSHQAALTAEINSDQVVYF